MHVFNHNMSAWLFHLINRFCVVVHLSSNRSQLTSKCAGEEQKSGTGSTVVCAMDVLTTFWCWNPSKCVYNSVYHINNDNWSICVLLPCSWVPEYSELGLSSIPTTAGVLILDWLNSQKLQWFWHRTVIFRTAGWIFCCPPD